MKKNWLLYCSSISSVPHPSSLQYEGGSKALGERKELTGHMNAMAPWRKNFQSFENRNFEAGIKHLHLSLTYKYQTVKYIYIICIMQLYFYHRALLAECTNCFASAVMIYFITPKPPIKGNLLSAVWQATGSIYFTLQHSTRMLCCSSVQETQTELCDSLVSFAILISAFLHVNTCHGPANCSLMLGTVEAGRSPSDSTLSPTDDFSHSLYPAGEWRAALQWDAGAF